METHESATLSFTAKNPATGEKITWKIQQKYADGTASNWTPATTLTATDSGR